MAKNSLSFSGSNHQFSCWQLNIFIDPSKYLCVSARVLAKVLKTLILQCNQLSKKKNLKGPVHEHMEHSNCS